MKDIKRKVLTDVIGHLKEETNALKRHEIKDCNTNKLGLDSLIVIKDLQAKEVRLVYAMPSGKGYTTTVSKEDDTAIQVITKETPIYHAISDAFEEGSNEFKVNGREYKILNHC